MDNKNHKNTDNSEEANEDIALINSNPEARRVFDNSLDDYAHGRFVDFKFKP